MAKKAQEVLPIRNPDETPATVHRLVRGAP